MIIILSMDSSELRYVRLDKAAQPPYRGSASAAGLDLASAYFYIIPSHGQKLCFTDLRIELPENTYGRIALRSSLALVYAIDVHAGVVDRDFCGNIGVLLFNHGSRDFHVLPGMRIAQLIVEKICTPRLVECTHLSDTQRGNNGFGSTDSDLITHELSDTHLSDTPHENNGLGNTESDLITFL